MIIDNSETICDVVDRLNIDKKDKDKIKELSSYDEFLIGDLYRFLNKHNLREKFELWAELNGCEYSGVRQYDKIILNTRWGCGKEVIR